MSVLVAVPVLMVRSRDTNLPSFAAKTQVYYAELEENHALEGRKMVVIVRRVLRMLWWNLGSDEDGAAGLLKERMFETEW